MPPTPTADETPWTTQRWVVPVVVCLAGAGWLSHAEGTPGHTIAAVMSVLGGALALAGAALPAPRRAALYAALLTALSLAPPLLAAPALLSPPVSELSRVWARLDQIIALAAVIASAPVALRRERDRKGAAIGAGVGAIGLALLAPELPGWGAAGLLISAGAIALLLLRGSGAQSPGVGVLRPAREGGRFVLNEMALQLLGLDDPAPRTVAELSALAAPDQREALSAALDDALRGLPVNIDLEVMDGGGRPRHLLMDGLRGHLQLRPLEQTQIARRARGADRAALAASLGNMGILVVDREGGPRESNDVIDRLAAPWQGPARWWAALVEGQERSRRRARTEPGDLSQTAEQVELTEPGTEQRRVFQVRQRYLGDGELLVLAEDVTGAVEAAEARQRAQAGLIGELDALRERQVSTQAFLARFNHEIRTPLNVIKGFSELMLDYCTEAQAQEDLQRIHSHAVTLGQLIDAVSELDWIQSGQLPLDRAAFDLSGVLDEVTHAVHGRMLARGNRLRVTYPRESIRMVGDRARLVQVLENLLDNAARFTENGAVQLVAGMGDGDTVDFVVRDSGIGMSAEQLSKLGQPFWQGAKFGADRNGSIGLGFTIVKGLVARMGGLVQVESHPSQGTLVNVNLPRELRGQAAPGGEGRGGSEPRGRVAEGAIDLAEARRRAQELDEHDTLIAPGRTVLVQGIGPRPPTLAGGPPQRKGGG